MISGIDCEEYELDPFLDEDSYAGGETPARGSIGDKLGKLFKISIAVILLLGAFQMVISGIAVAESDTVRLFKLGMAGAVEDANPYRGVMDEEYIYFGLIYNYLMFPNEDGVATPNIAHSWWYMDGNYAASSGSDFTGFILNPDPADWPLGSIWEYNISDGLKWNDGEDLTVDDIVWTFNVQIGPNFNSFWAYQPVTRWVDHAEKIGDDKVRIFFKHFATNEPMTVAWGYSVSVPIMPKHKFVDFPGVYMAQTWNGAPAVGAGPFKATENLIEELLEGESLTLLKNPWYNYTDAGPVTSSDTYDPNIEYKGIGGKYGRDVQIDKLLLKFFSEETSLALNVRTGDIDAAEIQADTYLKWKNESELGELPERLNILSMLSGTVYSKQIIINAYTSSTGNLNPLRLDPAVMRAAAIAINKTALINIVYKGLAVEGVGLISPVWPEWWWEPGNETSTFNVTGPNGEILFTYSKPIKDVMEYDPDLADQILDAAGYNAWTGEVGNSVRKATQLAGDRLQTILGIPSSEVLNFDLTFENVLYNEVFEDREIANYQASAWAEVGILGENTLLNMAERNKRIYSYNFEAMVTYWSADVDANYILYIPTSHALWGWNEFGTENDTYDYYYAMQATTLDYDERKKWVDECLKWQYLTGSLITIAYPKVCYAYNDYRFTNWGDWESHPNLATDHFWGEPPIFYRVQWTGITEEGGIPYLVMIAGAGIIAAIAGAIIFNSRRRKKLEDEIFRDESEDEKGS